MPAEKQNKIASALDGMNCIPEGFRFHQKRSWQKLQASLPSAAKMKRKILFYAAILIPAFVVLGYLITVTGTNRKYYVGSSTRAVPLNNDRKQNLVTNEKSVAVSKIQLHVKEKLFEREKKLIGAVTNTQKQVVLLDSSTSNTPLDVVESKTIDTAVAVVSIKPKPRFRIAHINELNSEPATSPGQMTATNIKKPFLASVTTVRASDEDRIVQKKKYLLSFLVNPMQ